MYRWQTLFAAMTLCVVIAMGCSGGNSSPVAPDEDINLNPSVQTSKDNSQTHLWGYYEVYFDLEKGTIEAVPNHSVQFAANVVQFVNSSPANLLFNINGTPTGPDYVDVDIDVSIKHPFSGLPQYNGYDVRGIFVGQGSTSLDYAGGMDVADMGTDQMVMADPVDGFGSPDGYSRFFNPVEFQVPGLFGYTPGIFSNNPGTVGKATVNPYKLFADGLGATDDVFDFLSTTTENAVFSSGTTNTRNYYIRFPLATTGVKYGYAIVANWESEDVHPSRAPETQAVRANVTDNVYYVGPADFGGDLILDIDVLPQPVVSAGIGDFNLLVASNTLNTTYSLSGSQMVPVGGDSSFSTYHVEIPVDNVTSTEGNEYWVIVEYPDYDYSNSFEVPNSASTDPLAAYFRYSLFVADEPYNFVPTVDDLEDDILGAGEYKDPVEITDTAVTYTALYTDTDPGDSHTITYYIVPDGDPYDAGDQVTMPIDWSTYPTADYDIVVEVDDGMDVGVGVFDITRNTLPVIDSGVDGNDTPFMGAVETYSVSAHDDDGDSISYSWTVTDSGNNPVIDNDPGNGDGTIDVDYSSLGAGDGDTFDIDCVVSDPLGSSNATTLNVTATNVLYSWSAATDGAGDLEVLDGNGGVEVWTYHAADLAYEEESGTGNYPDSFVTILGTPSLDLPSGYTNMYLEFTHYGRTEADWDGGMVCYTTDGGANYTVNGPAPGSAFLTYSSGQNFNSGNIWFPPNYGGWSWNGSWLWSTYPSTGWTGRYFTGGPWGSQASPVTSTFTMNGLMGTSNAQLCFLFIADWGSNTAVGWHMTDVSIYVD
ncbi:MAG TPA: hypothetical protein VGB30_04235 [bacterium]